MTKNVDTTVKTPFMQQQKDADVRLPSCSPSSGISFPVGVLVCWLTTNVWTMGQQMYVIRNNPTPGSKAQSRFTWSACSKHVTHAGEDPAPAAIATSSRRSSPRAATAASSSASSSTV
ncbi:hypothetical protein [Streptomyces sp. KL116D]|uniref:hypothetical protein n=1 Tax=Streptomyces sp. KL116D TaxID=3045152 RepID=UPI00355769D3